VAAGCADAVFHREGELLRIRWAGRLFDSDGNVDLDRLGVDQLEVEVAQGQRDGTPWCFKVRTREEAIAAVAKLRVGSLAEKVAGSPDASSADLADQGRSYATKFWATLGDPNGQRLIPGARGYTVYRLQPNGHRGERVFGRESYGPVMAAALGLPLQDGHLPGGTRDEFGFSEPRTAPVSEAARRSEKRAEQSQLKLARAALEEAARACGALAADAVAALFELCGERLAMLEVEFAPRLATASAAACAVAPSLAEPLADFVRADAIVARHEARPQVAGGKASAEAQGEQLLLDMGYSEEELLGASAEDKREMCGRVLGFTYGAIGHEAAAVACLGPKDKIAYESALDEGRMGDVERLLEKARKALSDTGAVACLEPKDKIEYESALDEGRMGDVERLLEKAHSLLAAKGGEANAGVLKPRLSQGELKDRCKHLPSNTRGEFHCQWGCRARASTLNIMGKHYRLVMKALEEGKETGPCKCTGPPAPALCAMGGAVDTPGTAAAAGSSADASVLKRKRRPSGRLADSENGDEGGDVDE